MLLMTNISISQRAAEILDRHRVLFRPCDPDDVFALVYMSSYVEPDGTPVSGFKPGYTVHSLSPDALGSGWALAQPAGAPEFLFMPRFTWSAGERYVIDVASEQFELLSIGPADTR